MIRFEPKPTRYSDTMPDLRTALEWVSMDMAMEQAGQSGKPILAVVAAPWSTGAHLLHRELTPPEIQQLVAASFIPVHLDPAHTLARTTKIAAMAQRQGGESALPLIAVLSAEGDPMLAWHFSAPEHRNPGVPTTGAMLQAVSEQWQQSRKEFLSEWDAARSALGMGIPDCDLERGGFQELTRQLHAYELAAAEGTDPGLQELLATIWIRGIRDQLEASFHPATRDANWVVPYFEKIMPQNAAMSLAYANVAGSTGDRAIRSQAQDLVRYCMNAFLQGTDVLSAESSYYTWLSPEAYDAVGRQNLQAVSLHYGIQPSAHRQVLSQVRNIAQIQQISFDTDEELSRRILAGNAEMLMARRTRPAPRPLAMDIGWRATTYRYLLLAMDELQGSEQGLLTNAFMTWLEGQDFSTHSDPTTDRGFQNQVMLLAGLLVAQSRVGDNRVSALVDDCLQKVREGLEFWRQCPPHESIWLYQHGYLPSIDSVLDYVGPLLPEGDALLLS